MKNDVRGMPRRGADVISDDVRVMRKSCDARRTLGQAAAGERNTTNSPVMANVFGLVAFICLFLVNIANGIDPQPEQIHLAATGKWAR